MPFRDRIEVSFDAGHRLLGYPGKCASPHGHTFRAELIVEGDQLDPCGLLVDFAELKATIKRWVDDRWDHAFLINSEDRALSAAFATVTEAKVFAFPSVNPTAEAMARMLFCIAAERFGQAVSAVRVWESTTQYGEFARAGRD
jgi:6-pyruvoyltetrahydropterin/6-carboxytetrahydropterin synthase